MAILSLNLLEFTCLLGLLLPDSSTISYFQFRSPSALNALEDHVLTIGNCRLFIETFKGFNEDIEQTSLSSRKNRSLLIEALWETEVELHLK